MMGPSLTSICVGERVPLAGAGFLPIRAFEPVTQRPVSVSIFRCHLVGHGDTRLAEVRLSVAPYSLAEPSLPIQNLERIYLPEEAREVDTSDLMWPHILILPTIFWKDELVCCLRADGATEA